MKIKRTTDGQLFEGPEGLAIPTGYERVGEPTAPSARSPRVPSTGPVPLFSSPRGFYGPGVLAHLESRLTGTTPEAAYRHRVPQLETATQMGAGVLMPWAKAPGLAGLGLRALQGGGVSGGLELLKTGDPLSALQSGGLGAAFQAGGEKAFDLGRYFLSAVPRHLFARKSALGLEQWVQTHIPSWAGLAAGKKSVERLVEWAHGTGEQTLSEKIYKEAIPTLKTAIPETLRIPLDHEAVAALGIPLPTVLSRSPLSATGFSVPVSAKEVIDGLPTLRKVGGPVYYRTLRQLMAALDEVPLASTMGDTAASRLSALRREYKEGMGFIDYARKSKMLAGNQYSPEAAQAGLHKYYQSEIRSRQMGEGLWDIIKGGRALRTSPNITEARSHPWGGAILGGAAGGALGLGAGGLHGLGLGGGAGSALGYGIGMSPRFRNVPMTSITEYLRSLGAFSGGQMLQAEMGGP